MTAIDDGRRRQEAGTAGELVRRALTEFLLLRDDPPATLDAALAADPGAGRAVAFRAYLDLFAQTADALRSARQLLDDAAALGGEIDDQDRLHLLAARAWADGEMEDAARLLDVAVERDGRDLLAVRIGHDLAFFLGDARNLRDGPARALSAWGESDPDWGLLQGMYAFGLEETGEYRRAEAAARGALRRDRRDVWAAHALAHVLEMQGRPGEGIDFLSSSSPDWSASFFAIHNWWHLALYRIELGDDGGAVALYDGPIRAGGSDAWLDLVDATALLWRLSLLGVDVADRAARLVPALEERLEEAIYPFNDLHALMGFALAGRHDLVAALVAHRSHIREGTAGRALDAAGFDLLDGFASFGRGEHLRSMELLRRARPRATVIGGSHAQRDVIDQTLLVAAARAGEVGAVRALVSERLERRHWSAESISRLAGGGLS